MITTQKSKMPMVASAKEESMMAWAFEHSSNAKLITNLKHEIQIVNRAFLDWFDFTPEEVIGQNAAVLLRSRSLGPELFIQIPQSLETTGEWKGEVLNSSKKGIIRPCLLSITSIYSPAGEKIGYLGVDIDLTERKKMEAQVQQGEKLSNIGESVATLMHEIRNPLAGIAMNVFMLETRAEKCKAIECKYSDESERESLRLISKEVKRLEALVKNALNYARNTQLRPEKVPLRVFFDEVKKLVLYESAQKSVAVRIEKISEDLSAFFDPDLMKQVFINLVRNAIEATVDPCERTVRLAVEISEAPDWRFISASARVLLFHVDNCGEKVSEQQLENLFKPFFTSKAEGIGLGLATASKIVRQHHGILIHSHLEESPFTTRFTVALPI